MSREAWAVCCGTGALIAGIGSSEIAWLSYTDGPRPCALLFRYDDARRHSDHRGRVEGSLKRLERHVELLS